MSERDSGVAAVDRTALIDPDAYRSIDITGLARQCRFVTMGNYFMLVLGVLKVPILFALFIRESTISNLSIAMIGMALYGSCAWVAWNTRSGLDAITYRYSIPAFLAVAGVSICNVVEAAAEPLNLVNHSFDAMAGLATLGGVVAVLTLRRTWLPAFNVRLDKFLQHGKAKVQVRPAKGSRWLVFLALGLAWFVGIALIPSAFLANHHDLATAVIYINALGFGFLSVANYYFQPDYQTLIREDPRPPILLLRSFADDGNATATSTDVNVLNNLGFVGYSLLNSSLEDRLAFHYSAFGPFVASAGPSKGQIVGAIRVKLTDEEWQDKVLGMMKKSRLIILLTGVGDSLSWELKALIRGKYINKTVFMFSKVPRRIRNHLAPTAARLQFLSRGLAGTSWGAALYSLSKRYAPDEVRAVACTPSGVVAVTSADRSRDSYYIAAVVAHYLVQPWEYCPAPVNPGYDTPDAYNRDHLASTGSRSVATLLDSAIILVLFAILTWPKTPSLTGVKVVGYISVLAFAYYWLFEGLAGATLGKLICAIEVRSSSSWKVGGMRSSAVRNLLRVVDAIGFYGVGFAISQASPLRQRLGDRLAGTVVVGRRRSIGLLLALCTFIACLTASGVNAVFQVLSHGHHVTIGSNDEVYYSGSSTKSAAMALGSALKANGFFRDKGSKVFLSRDHSETVLSLVAKDDDWIEADVAFFYDRFGLQAAASIGGLPMKVRLLDSTLETRKVVSAGKVTLGTRDGVYYFGAAREDDAKALGGALRAAGFFSGKGKEVVLLKGKLRTILFPVAEGDWDNFENILFFEALTRKVAPSVGGLPVDVRLVNASFETKKVWTVQ